MTGGRPVLAYRVLPGPAGASAGTSLLRNFCSLPSSQLPAGDCSHLIALRQGAVPLLRIGVFSHTTRLCRATAHRLGPLSKGSGEAAGGISDGVSQYGLALANDRSAAALGECRSAIAPVTDSFSSAPTCSWDALIVLRIFRANHTPAARKAIWLRRFPSAYQLLCIQAVNSFMASPWTGTPSMYNSARAVETGRKSRKRAGVPLARPNHSTSRIRSR
jgi:hypothetical protein